MSWRDRAIPVPTSDSTPIPQPSGSDWKSRATPISEDPSTLEALGRGAVQGATLGFGDEIGGGLEAGFDKLTGNDTPLLDLYQKHRDEIRAKNKAATRAHPIASVVGNIAGSVPTFLAGGAIPEIASLGVAGRGALEAGLMAAGDTEASPVSNPGQFVSDVGKSALIGAGTAGLAKAAAPYMQKAANKLAVTSLGPRLKQLRRMIGTDKVNEMGQMLNDEGVIRPLASAEGTYERLADKTNDLGTQIATSIRDNANTPVIETTGLADAIKREVNPALADIPEGGRTAARLGNYLDDELVPKGAKVPYQGVGTEGPNTFDLPQDERVMNLGEAWNVRKGIDKAIDFDKAVPDMPGWQQGLVTTRNKIQSAIRGAVPADQQQLFDKYHVLESAENMAKDTAARNMANRTISPSDYITGVGGMIHGGTPEAIVTGGLNHLARTRGASTGAWALNNLSKLLSERPDAFGQFATPLMQAAKRGSQALAVTHYVLSQDNPQYRDLLDKFPQQ